MLNNFILQGVIVTKVTQQNTCYISIMNRSEMPSFNNLARLAQESRVRFPRSSRVLTPETIGPFLHVILRVGEEEIFPSGRVLFFSAIVGLGNFSVGSFC